MSVKATGSGESRVQNIHTVGGAQHNDSVRSCESIHLDQQLIEGLILLHLAATTTDIALSSGSVDFINEDDAGSLRTRLLEELANTARPYTDEHFHKFRT